MLLVRFRHVRENRNVGEDYLPFIPGVGELAEIDGKLYEVYNVLWFIKDPSEGGDSWVRCEVR